ncbi:winged helix-turn-helix transcriptional regulator [Candidatus Giovannonibacteria bacterium]|nr:winged helix-turn-helix transcriptional regulator [Candidatus Giovannonibacteria bacterium]
MANSKINNIEKSFKALANKKRIEILLFLRKVKSASVGEISEEISISLKSTSKHLLILYGADFVEKERVHGLTIYVLKDNMDLLEKTLSGAVFKNL